MEIEKLVGEEKDYLIKKLDDFFPQTQLSDLPQIAESIEDVLRIMIEKIIRKYSELLLGIKCDDDNCYLTSEEKCVLFTIKSAIDIKNKNTLIVVVEPNIVGETNKLLKFNIFVNGYGEIRNILFYYPNFLKIRLDFITFLLKNLLETGYNWFVLKVDELVSNEKVYLTQQLYKYSKQIIPQKKLRKHLWFATVTKGYGFRLIDPDIAMNLFEEIDPYSDFFSKSTNILAAHMLTTKLPQNKILMQKAIDQNKILDVDIKDASYTKEGNIYSAAMSAFYGGDSFTIHPILIDNKSNVVALYPTDKKQYLETILETHKKNLQKICKNSISLIHRSLENFEKRKSNINYGIVGELVGGIAKAFTG